MNKQYCYRGYEFNITVMLNTCVDKGINGKPLHSILISCLSVDNYVSQKEVDADSLKEEIELQFGIIRQYVDKKLSTESEEYKAIEILRNLGFE